MNGSTALRVTTILKPPQFFYFVIVKIKNSNDVPCAMCTTDPQPLSRIKFQFTRYPESGGGRPVHCAALC